MITITVVPLPLFWFVVICMFSTFVSFFIGIGMGARAERERKAKHVGSLITAPEDEDGGPYVYMKIDEPFEEWLRNGEEVMFYVREVTKAELERRSNSRI